MAILSDSLSHLDAFSPNAFAHHLHNDLLFFMLLLFFSVVDLLTSVLVFLNQYEPHLDHLEVLIVLVSFVPETV